MEKPKIIVTAMPEKDTDCPFAIQCTSNPNYSCVCDLKRNKTDDSIYGINFSTHQSSNCKLSANEECDMLYSLELSQKTKIPSIELEHRVMENIMESVKHMEDINEYEPIRTNKERKNKTMTKNAIKAKLQLAVNLASLTNKVCDDLCNSLTPDDYLCDLTDNIRCNERTDVNEIMAELETANYFADADIIEDGPEVPVPELNIENGTNLSIKTPVNGGYLIAETGESDFGTKQACLLYEYNDYQIDLAFAEVRAGELAEIANLSADNKDVDLYIYENPYSEDYTSKKTISHTDIQKALSDE